MLNIGHFDEVFGSVGKNHYPTHLVNQVQSARDQLGDKLFFHQLLDALHIEASGLYPPKNAKELRELHKTIATASCQEIQKQSLLYYLLKDCGLVAKDNQPAELFQKTISLPQRYWLCMQGLWCLDKLRWDEAVSFLTQPALVPAVFSSEILATLLRAEQDHLALVYYGAMQPSLNSASLLDSYFRALSRASLTQAFYFMRRQSPSPDVRQPLLEALVEAALSIPAGEERRAKSLELLDLPFDSSEKSWFRDYLTKHSGRSIDVSQDALLLNLLIEGDYKEAIQKMGRRKAAKGLHAGVTWESIADGLNKGIGPRRQLDGLRID